jgi:hypothetical protein
MHKKLPKYKRVIKVVSSILRMYKSVNHPNRIGEWTFHGEIQGYRDSLEDKVYDLTSHTGCL